MAVTLARAGVTWRSILLYPLRRRLFSQQRIDLKDGISIVAPAHESLLPMFREIWVESCYAPGGPVALVQDTIVDVGANIGVFALWAAKTYPQARIISLEPSPRMRASLQRNIAANRLKNITVVPSACGGRRREAVLYRRGPESWNSLYNRDNYGSRFCPLTTTEVLTLGDVFERFEISACGLLKLDCEGAEYEILLAAEPRLLENVERIAMEYHVGLNEYRPEMLSAFLEAHGFEVDLLPMVDEEAGYLYAKRRN